MLQKMIFDDMTKGAEEATDSTEHQSLYNKWTGNWINRRDGDSTKFVFAGTMWSPEDILNRIIADRESISELIPSDKFKYVWESKDGTTVVIRVPLLDENDETTCEAVMTTEEARQLRDVTDEFQWACVYQQDPIPAEGLNFADDLLNHFEQLPINEDGTPFSSALTGEQKKHLSEIALDNFDEFDYVIEAKNLEDIDTAVKCIIKEI